MRSYFMRGILLCLIAIFVVFFRLVLYPQAVAEKISTPPATEPYSLSYAAGRYDQSRNFLGGTELISLVAFQGKLYAGIGYWMDQPRLFPLRFDPLSGAQILVLDSKFGQWQQESRFSQKNGSGDTKYMRVSAMQVIQFHRFDAAGNVLGVSAEMLVVGLGGRGAGGAVYTQKSPGVWEDTQLPTLTPIRSLAVHYDPINRVERLYAGAGRLNTEGSIYSGIYEPSAPGRIRWNPTPEQSGLRDRVISLADCNGTIFAAAKPNIFRRDDNSKTWEITYSHPIQYQFDQSKYASGFRALTCIDKPSASGKKALLTGFESFSGDILRVDPETGIAVVELHAREFLTQQWGSPPTERDIITGYNDVPLVKNSPDVRLFGLLARSPNENERDSAWLLSRTNNDTPQYELHEVKAPIWPNRRSDTALWAVRAIAISPFPEDHEQILYLGGYDGHFEPDHNTAWIYRVGIDTALKRYQANPNIR